LKAIPRFLVFLKIKMKISDSPTLYVTISRSIAGFNEFPDDKDPSSGVHCSRLPVLM